VRNRWKCNFFIALVTTWSFTAVAASLKPFHQMTPTEIDALVKETSKTVPSAKDRFLLYSERFLGVPYRLFPLGLAPVNGKEDPPIRFDVADCTTMIETLIALSFANNLEEATTLMARVRYKNGVVRQQTKNDYPETDWIPNNISAGFLQDITSRMAGKKTAFSTKVIRVKQYNEQELAQLQELTRKDPEKAIDFLRDLNPMGKPKEKQAKLPYLPLGLLTTVGGQIPSGTIFSIVREDRPDKEVAVTHQGLIIQKADGPYVRHMAFKEQGLDIPMLAYFGKYKDSQWKVLGINLTLIKGP